MEDVPDICVLSFEELCCDCGKIKLRVIFCPALSII